MAVGRLTDDSSIYNEYFALLLGTKVVKFGVCQADAWLASGA